jgi:signal transduction histidine kinase
LRQQNLSEASVKTLIPLESIRLLSLGVPEEVDLAWLNDSQTSYLIERVHRFDSIPQLLSREIWDILLIDCRYRPLDLTNLIESINQTGLQIPILIISQNLDEDCASYFDLGIRDWLTPERLFLLPSIIKREVREFQSKKQLNRQVWQNEENIQRLTLLESFLDSIHGELIVCSLHGSLIYISKTASDRLRLYNSFLDHNTIFDADPSLDVNIWKEIQTHLEELGHFKRESILIYTNGEKHPAEMRFTLKQIFGLQYVIILIYEIRERKNFENTLKIKELEARYLARHYKSILETQNIYVRRFSDQKECLFNSVSYEQKYQVKMRDTFGSVESSIFEEDREHWNQIFDLCIQNPEKAQTIIYREKLPDGSLIGGKWEYSVVRSENSLEIIAIGHDVTDLLENLEDTKQLLALASEQNMRLQNFAYILSHNVRSHSANLKGILSLMETEKELDVQAEYFSMLCTSTNKLNDAIFNLNEILSIFQNQNVPREKIFLNRELNQILELFREPISKFGINISINIDDNLWIYTILGYFRDIVYNIISNSIRYRNPEIQSSIKISGCKDFPFVLLTFEDNGLGIDIEKYGHKLFGMYNTFHSNPDARGLGLFITKNQVESMGGKINLESELGVGTKIMVSFYEKI